MNKMRSLLYGMAISSMALFMGSCEETISPETTGGEAGVLEIGVDRIRTRALDDAFEEQDRIGLYVVKWEAGEATALLPSDNYADNVGFTLQDNADNWQSDETIYFPAEGDPLDLYAYYPYADPLFEEGTTTVNFRIRPDQRNYADYTASDFVTADRKAVSRTAGKVNLTFDHKLSQLVFALKAGDGFTVEELSTATITIKNALITATYDLAEGNEGTPVAGSERSDVLPTGAWEVSSGDESLLYGYKGIIVPQELSDETYFEIALGSRTFTQKFSTPITLQSGESRLFTITMKNTGLEISTTLNPWNYGDPVEGEAEEPEKREFDPDAFVVVFECLSEGTGYGSFSFAPKISLGEGEVPFCNCVIDWGDGSEPEHVVEPIGKTHSYAKPGVYYATITGSTDYLSIGTNYYLKSIEQWGDLGIKTWFEAFKDCSQLASIPTEIPPSESFEGTFWNTGLKSIPAGLFSQCGSAKSFKYTFTACSKLETIGEGIFKNCISAEDFERTFTGCVNLKAIPADLFKDCINANSFLATFQGCIEVREIPEALFETCTKATDFLATFSSCYSLTSIPVSLFDYNLDVITFGSTFAGCTLAIGGTPNTNGIELWMRSDPQYTQYPDEIDVQGCFGGCKNLANYDDIPDEAK